MITYSLNSQFNFPAYMQGNRRTHTYFIYFFIPAGGMGPSYMEIVHLACRDLGMHTLPRSRHEHAAEILGSESARFLI